MTASEPAGFCENSRSQGRMPASQHMDANGPLPLISCMFRPGDATLLPAEKEVDSSTWGFVNRRTQGTAANPEFPTEASLVCSPGNGYPQGPHAHSQRQTRPFLPNQNTRNTQLYSLVFSLAVSFSRLLTL